MKKISFLMMLVLLIASCNPVKIACVGDSITEGSGISKPSQSAYPVVLNQILGKKYLVLNSGKSASTLQFKGDLPYRNCKEFSNVFAFQPDIVLIKLGTNDTKPQNWKLQNFEADYQAMVDTFKTISPKTKIILIKPVPVFATKWGINDSTLINGVLPTVERIALKNNLQVIDLNNAMKNAEVDFPDKIHPNEDGARKMAEIIADQIR